MAESTRLPPDAAIGSVQLVAGDAHRLKAFYRRSLGLRLLSEEAGLHRLGAGERELIVLENDPGAPKLLGTAGLYHLAVLLPSRIELARALQRLLHTQTPIEGFADHGVSEAIYLSDPEGNGIEIYCDRPRPAWPRKDGKLRMGTWPLDTEDLLGELPGAGAEAPPAEAAPESRIGHVHLQVTDIEASDRFYAGVLGFDLVMHFGPSAGFVSAGGYHHHIGYNAWAGPLAPTPSGKARGLKHFSLLLPGRASLEAAAERVREAGIQLEQESRGRLFVRDPSGIRIALEVAGRVSA